jgi:hypothetical protein
MGGFQQVPILQYHAMLPAITKSALDRLLEIHCRSFAQYLLYARPYTPPGTDEKLQTVHHVAEDQQQMGERIAALVREAGLTPYMGKFPMEFTDLHDLSIDYLFRQAIHSMRRDVASIEACVQALKGSPAARALAEEALGMAKGHLRTLEEVAANGNIAVVTSKAG